MRTSTRCNRVVDKWRTRWSKVTQVFLTMLLLAFIAPGASAQLVKIDGLSNSYPNEWTQAGIVHVQDMFDQVNQDNIFEGNEKDFFFANNWFWKLGTAKDKNDIANGAAGILPAGSVILADGTVASGGPFLVFAGDRISNNGDAQIGFWFFQDGTAPVTVSGVNTFAPAKHVPPVIGDILVLADFTGGGNNATITVLEWVGTGGTYPNTNGAFNQILIGAAVAENNAGTTPVPTGWLFVDKTTGSTTNYSTNEFYEGYLNLAAFGPGAACFSRYMLETRASQSITATLDDFVSSPLGGVPTAPTGVPGNRCGTGSVQLSATGCAGGTLKWYSAASGGTLLFTGVPFNTPSISTTTSYWVSCTNANGCEGPRTEVVATVNTIPTASAGPNQTLCNTSSFTMAANNPSPFSGLWTVVSGTATITTPTSNTTTVTGVPANTTAVLRWTVTNGNCVASATVTLRNDQLVVAAAGPNQAQCNNGSFTMAANSPAPGTGLWTVVSGTATITTPTSNVTTVTGVPVGTTAVLRWTITNGTCTSSATVSLTNDQLVVAAAGPNQTNCNSGSFTLAGSNPAPGTGLWTVVSGTATITTPTSPTSGVTGVPIGTTATLRWTVTNGTCTSSATVTLTNTQLITASAGPDQTLCNTSSFTMAGSSPAPGTGLWTVVSGTATITTPTSNVTTVTGVPAGTSAVLRWTVTNGNCTSSATVTLRNDQLVVATAGPNQTLCNTSSFTMAANSPAPGTGLWTVVSGTATITTPTSNVTTVTGVPAGTTAVLRWTITNGVCTSSATVSLTNTQLVVANAGPNQTLCNTSSFTMAANSPAPGTGLWTVVSGTATITTPTSNVTTVTGVPAGTTAVLRWTITNGVCSSSATVSLTNDLLVVAAAGPNQTNCNNGSFTLAGSNPAPGTGLWTVVSGTATITTPTSPTSGVTGVPIGTTATLRWTVTNGTCTSSATVTLTNTQLITASAGPDQTLCNTSSFTMAGSSPAPGTGLWTIVSGAATITTPTSPTTTVTGVAAGTSVVLRWTVTNGNCTSSATVTLRNDQLVVATAGPNQTQCNNGSFTLAANSPAPGTGLWTVVSGTATITTPSSPTSGVTGVPVNTTAVLRWTITNGVCTSSATVSLTNTQLVVANAGPNQTLCNTSTFTMAANSPAPGTGLWTVVSGTATITTPTSNVTTVTGVPAGTTAVLRWTITNGICTSSATVTLRNDQLVVAAAGPNQTKCENGTFTMAANSPAPGTGLWTVVSGTATITTPTSNVTTVTGVPLGGTAVLRWTITNGVCTSSATVTLINVDAPTIFTLAKTDFCVNNPNTGTITLSSSQIGVSYQLIGDVQGNVQAPKAGTGSSLTWTGLAADNYRVKATGPLGPDGCPTLTNPTPVVSLALPEITADDKTVCAGESVTLTGTINGLPSSSGVWTGPAGTVSGTIFTAPGPGTYTVTFTFTNPITGCSNSDQATITVELCGDVFCTYTQGAYGNLGGMHCDGLGNQFSTDSMITRAINAQGGMIRIGQLGRSVTVTANANGAPLSADVIKVMSVLPGGGAAKMFPHSGNIAINTISGNTWLKNGRINNTLFSQTLTLSINMGVKAGLGALVLQGDSIVTAEVDGGCGGENAILRVCNYDPLTGALLSVDNEYEYYYLDPAVLAAISAIPANRTVAGLLTLANDALANVDGIANTERGVGLSEIAGAVDAINNAFDECRSLIGFNVPRCAPSNLQQRGGSNPANTTATVSQATSNFEGLTVTAYPNPFNKVVKFTIESKVSGQAQLEVFNMMGQKLSIVYNGFIQANKGMVVEYNAPLAAQQNLIYVLKINGETVTGKLLNAR